jgi:hypothetical protein
MGKYIAAQIGSQGRIIHKELNAACAFRSLLSCVITKQYDEKDQFKLLFLLEN